MSDSWSIIGVVREKPRDRGCYRGEDVYHPLQPNHGQIDEMLENLKPDHPSLQPMIMIVGVRPSADDTEEDIIKEFSDSVKFALEVRRKNMVSLTKILENK